MTDALLCVNGEWRSGESGHFDPVLNPANEEVIGRVAHASDADVAGAIQAASSAFADWSRSSPIERSEILERASRILSNRSSEIARVLTIEQGKPLAESLTELERAVATFSWHAHAVHRVCSARQAGAASIHPEPIGVGAALTPWNYPAVIVARKLAAALAAGCTVILKAAEETPFVAVAIVTALCDAGLPPGVVTLVFGDPPSIARCLLDAREVCALSFTGSTAVGKQLAASASRTLKRCVLELGGHAPVLVFRDSDLDVAARAIASYKFDCAGQSCNAPSRIYVERAAFDSFVDTFVSIANGLRVGEGIDPATQMGPLATERRLTAIEGLVADARRRGARVLCGGSRIERAGWFWPPTVVTDLEDDAAMLVDEPFGPIAPILSFETLDEAIARANDNPYGLAAYVMTASESIATEASRRLAAGSVGINQLAGVPPDVGIAGIKDSGYGYEGGQAGIEAFLNLKVVRNGGQRAAI
jgi:succinate-semialdehyde dehydrogenase / glutarate-semialdehyde dehydrogenase